MDLFRRPSFTQNVTGFEPRTQYGELRPDVTSNLPLPGQWAPASSVGAPLEESIVPTLTNRQIPMRGVPPILQFLGAAATGALDPRLAAQLPDIQRKRRIEQAQEQAGFIPQDQVETLNQILRARQEERIFGETRRHNLATEARLGEAARLEAIRGREIDTYTNDQGRRVTVFQRPDGTTYEQVFGSAMQKNEPSIEDDRKYQAIIMRLTLKQPISAEENAFKVAYEKRKTLVTTETGRLAKQRLEISLTGGDPSGQSVDSWVKQINANPSLLSSAPRGLRNEIVKRADLIIPPKVKESFVAFDQAERLIDIIADQVEDVVSAPDPGEKARRSLLLEGTVNSFSSILSRSVFTEVGVKTEGDINRAKSLLPGWKAANFDPTYARKEISILRGLLQGNRDIAIRFAGGGGLSEAQRSQERSLGQSRPGTRIYNGYEYIKQPDGSWLRGNKVQ